MAWSWEPKPWSNVWMEEFNRSWIYYRQNWFIFISLYSCVTFIQILSAIITEGTVHTILSLSIWTVIAIRMFLYQALSEAILAVTSMNADLSVEKIEIVRSNAVSHWYLDISVDHCPVFIQILYINSITDHWPVLNYQHDSFVACLAFSNMTLLLWPRSIFMAER